ncbi:MAG: ABC transporter substrate-binding protein [Chloroflexota bacterium]|nr:ABC transporter substrate-binding protein [Chloroflexota bacterium]
MSRRRMSLVGLLIVIALVMPMTLFSLPVVAQDGTACPDGSTGSSDGPVRIGVILPLSGSLASVGGDNRAAVELAAQIANDEIADLALPLAAGAGLPNLGGAEVELVFADSQGRAEVGQSEAQRLIDQEGVVALFGAYQSAVTKTASAVAERSGIPFVNGASSSPDLTEQGYIYFFRTSPHDINFSQSIFDYLELLASEYGAEINGISLFYEDTDFGVNSAAAETAEAEARGLPLAGEVRYRANATSLTSEVQALQGQEANILIPSSYTTDSILLMQTARNLGYLPDVIVAQDAGFVDPAFLDAIGADAEGVASRAAFSIDIADVKPAAGAVNDLYRELAGKDLYDVPARGFTGMNVLLDAINRACSTDPELIRQALIDTNLGADDTIMPWNGVQFDETGQNTLGAGIIVQFQEGEYRTVFPTEFAVAEPVYPLAPWEDR